MNEQEIIQITKGMPLTVESLKNRFKKLGIKPGMVLLVHSSLSSLGWVCGGPTAVIMALEELLDPEGTLVMPTCSGDLSEPSKWKNPPVPQSWWQLIKEEMPAYNPDLTPTRGMGAIPESFRKQEGTLRSGHPQVSFAARGKYAREITTCHSLDYALGENSPLARIYDLDGWVLMLGVEHINNTSIHLAEYRADYQSKKVEMSGSPVEINGKRIWRELEDIEPDDSDLGKIGSSFEKTFPDKFIKQKIGEAQARLFRQRDIVDYATKWITENRK